MDLEKDLNYFLGRFNEVADEAKEYGHSVVVIMENSDPIARQSSVSTIFRGTFATVVGLLHCALMEFQRR